MSLRVGILIIARELSVNLSFTFTLSVLISHVFSALCVRFAHFLAYRSWIKKVAYGASVQEVTQFKSYYNFHCSDMIFISVYR